MSFDPLPTVPTLAVALVQELDNTLEEIENQYSGNMWDKVAGAETMIFEVASSE